MEWKEKDKQARLGIVSCVTQAAPDDEKCRYCGRLGCTDRGLSFTVGDPPMVLLESAMARDVQRELARLLAAHRDDFEVDFVAYQEDNCIRNTKRPCLDTILEKIGNCDEQCQKKLTTNELGVSVLRDEHYQCPFRDSQSVCSRLVTLDNSPLTCANDKEGRINCFYHEQAYRRCELRGKEDCPDLMVKFCGSNDLDNKLLCLSHRFNAARCIHSEDGLCNNVDSLHFEGMCTLHGLMSPCEHYEATEKRNEGVYTVVNSIDGKDDRLIFNTSDYAHRLTPDQATTLCVACRISHSIAKATGLKCGGVRRASTHSFLNEDNLLNDNAIEIDYLYLTHPDDMAKYNPEVLAKAVFDALLYNCKGLGCEEYDHCLMKK